MIERYFVHSVSVVDPSDGVEDLYGNTGKVDANTPGTEYRGRVSPLTTEELRLYEDATVTRKKLRLPLGAVIESDSIVIWDGKKFQVEAEPEVMETPTRGPSHVRAILRIVEGA